MAITSPRASAQGFRPAPTYWGTDLAGWIRLVAETLNLTQQGKLNCTGTVTLTANQATTTLSDPRIGANTKIHLTPTTANAAAEVGAGTLYPTYPNATEGQAVLNHANNAQTDRDYVFSLIG